MKLNVLSLLCLAGLLACSNEPQPRLAADALLGRSRDELTARLGEAKHQAPEADRPYGHMTWPDVDSVQVFVTIMDGRSNYVSYMFRHMDPFDEARALAMVDLDLPTTEPETVPESQARRWRPYRQWPRLTINPRTKLISVGAHPMVDVPPDSSGG